MQKLEKIRIFFFYTKVDKQTEITKILEIKHGSLSKKFLGPLLFTGACRLHLWKGLVDICLNRMDVWKSKWLTCAR